MAGWVDGTGLPTPTFFQVHEVVFKVAKKNYGKTRK